ncbi:hypothetical protein HAX54_011109, partial [Datura stramonium]|nr:hypothetical protein [Datura stramonium]
MVRNRGRSGEDGSVGLVLVFRRRGVLCRLHVVIWEEGDGDCWQWLVAGEESEGRVGGVVEFRR